MKLRWWLPILLVLTTTTGCDFIEQLINQFSPGGQSPPGDLSPSNDGGDVNSYAIATECEGGGGLQKCTATNYSGRDIGPFALEIKFTNNRGLPIGQTTVINDQGLESNDSWDFELTCPVETVGVNVSRVVPK